MGVTTNGLEARLACGTALGTLIDEVADGPDPRRRAHERDCAHCQAALADLRALWSEVRELADETVVAPEGLASRVIATIRERGRTPGHAALVLDEVVPRLVEHARVEEERGTTRIADTVVARVAAGAAGRVPGVSSLSRLRPGDRATAWRRRAGAARGVVVEVDGSRVTVGLRVTVDYGFPVADVVEGVREAVIEDVGALTGLFVAAVNVAVDGLRVIDR